MPPDWRAYKDSVIGSYRFFVGQRLYVGAPVVVRLVLNSVAVVIRIGCVFIGGFYAEDFRAENVGYVLRYSLCVAGGREVGYKGFAASRRIVGVIVVPGLLCSGAVLHGVIVSAGIQRGCGKGHRQAD